MKTLTTITIFLIEIAASAQHYEQGMQKASGLWQEGKTKEAAAIFERIAAAEPETWLPNYNIALINVTLAFNPKFKEEVPTLLQKAQVALDKELSKDAENAELLVLQALIYTGYIVQDPMTNGMLYSEKVMQTYNKALQLEPNNPRVVAGKAEFEMGGAKYFGGDIKAMCAEIDRAINLFATFKPESSLHPNWGLERAIQIQKECSSK